MFGNLLVKNLNKLVGKIAKTKNFKMLGNLEGKFSLFWKILLDSGLKTHKILNIMFCTIF